MKFGLKNEVITKINLVFESYSQVEQVIIYGSRAKGNFKNGSDIDLTLIGNKLNSTILSNINEDVDNLDTPYMFDISIFHKLNSPSLEEHITRIGQVFYKKA